MYNNRVVSVVDEVEIKFKYHTADSLCSGRQRVNNWTVPAEERTMGFVLERLSGEERDQEHTRLRRRRVYILYLILNSVSHAQQPLLQSLLPLILLRNYTAS